MYNGGNYDHLINNRRRQRKHRSTITTQNVPELSDETTQVFSEFLFNIPLKNLLNMNFRIKHQSDMTTTDYFCILIEVMLYGVEILSRRKSLRIFDLTSTDNALVYNIKSYFQSIGIVAKIDAIEFDEPNALYRDRDDYYCEIVPKPPNYLMLDGWYVGENRLVINRNIDINNLTFQQHYAFFIANDVLYKIQFDYCVDI